MLEFGDAAVGAAGGSGEAFLLKRIQGAADDVVVERHDGLAIIFLVAGVDERVQRKWIVIGSSNVLFDERSEDASLDCGENDIRQALFSGNFHSELNQSSS